jgi:hypothetical protein
MKKNSILKCIIALLVLAVSCTPPPKKEKIVHVKHNYIILLDLSDRLIIQDNQPERDKEIIKHLYSLFEDKVMKELYVKSRDEIKVVIAPQLGSGLATEIYEDRLYINMENIKNIFRKSKEGERHKMFYENLDTLYKEAVFSKDPKKYYGADIWKYFYEDLKTDFVKDSLTENFLFILTDGYPIVGKDKSKLQPLNNKFPNLKVAIIEASPRETDMEWDRIMSTWQEWFTEIGVTDYTLIKRKAITKEKEELKDLINENR